MCRTRNIYVARRIFWQQKMVPWHGKPLWLFDKLGLYWDPFCENCLRQRLNRWARRFRFEPVAQPETGLSLRPFMKSAPGAGFRKGLKSGLRLKSETLGSNIVNILLSLWTQTQSISQTGSTWDLAQSWAQFWAHQGGVSNFESKVCHPNTCV